MKNKITKLSLILLLSSFAVNAQTEAQRINIIAKSSVENSNKLQKKLEQEGTLNYSLAIEKANREGKSISGTNEDGSSYTLVGVDNATNELIYYKTTNNVPVKSSLQTANAKPLHSLGIMGQNMIVGVWDGGQPYLGHRALGNRVIVKDGASVVSKHATHVTGTIAADDPGDDNGKQAMGFAPKAIVWANEYDQAKEKTFGEMINLAKQGLLVSNHSYGLDSSRAGSYIPGAYGRYNEDSRSVDLIANDFPKYTIVFAAGNDRDGNYNPVKGGRDLLTHEGVAKNTIVVASTLGTEDYSEIAGANSVRGFLSGFSNWGPTDDFRIKPDISAKGDGVISLGVGNPYDIALMSGTSMAAPAVTGVVVLWQQYFNEFFGDFMNSATVRAVMAHTAKEAGEAEGPDYKFGWGLIDADAGAQIMREKTQNLAVLAELKIEEGKKLNYEFDYDGKQPLIATIAWNDPAGEASTLTDRNYASLVNDLDLKVKNLDTNQEFLPWGLIHNPLSVAPNIADRMVNSRDNIEKVNVNSNVAGRYVIEVSHKGNLLKGAQDFSLIVSGSGTVMPPLGNLSNETQSFTKMQVFPNPVNDNLNVSGDQVELEGASIQVYNMSGRKVIDKKDLFFGKNVENIDVSGLEGGVYLLDISNNGLREVVKFVKK